MTRIQLIKWVVGILSVIITGIVVPIYIKSMPDKKIIEAPGHIMIEQTAAFPGGGGGDYTIEKTIRITKKTNQGSNE